MAKTKNALELILDLDHEVEIKKEIPTNHVDASAYLKNFSTLDVIYFSSGIAQSEKDAKGNVIKTIDAIVTFRGKLMKMDANKIDEKNMLEKIWEEIKNVKVDVQKMNNDMQNLSSQVVNINNQVQDLNNQVQDLNNQVQTMNTELQEVKKTVTSIDQRLTKVEAKVDSMDKRLENVENDVAVLKKDVADIKNCPTIKKELLKK